MFVARTRSAGSPRTLAGHGRRPGAVPRWAAMMSHPRGGAGIGGGDDRCQAGTTQ